MTLIRPPVMPMATNMRHVVQLVLPLTQFVATRSRHLSWSHFFGRGFGFTVAALPGLGFVAANGTDGKRAARMFYVATTRITARMLITVNGTAAIASAQMKI